MAPTIVLITGANRGLGLELVVVAATRDPASASSQALAGLPKGDGSKLVVVKYDAAKEADAHAIAKEVQEKHGVDHLDIVVANAGIAKSYPLVKDARRAEILEHLEVNVLSVVALYQATRDLLHKSQAPNKPVFAPMGSGAGALGRQPPVPSAVYGASKSMVNWYGVRINAEDDWLNTFVLDPAWVQTDMGDEAARLWGLKSAPTTVDEACDGLYKVLTTGTKEEYGGKVVMYTGEVQVW